MDSTPVCNGCLSHVNNLKVLPCSHKFCPKCSKKCRRKDTQLVICLTCHAKWAFYPSSKKMKEEDRGMENKTKKQRVCSSCKREFTSEDATHSQTLLLCRSCTTSQPKEHSEARTDEKMTAVRSRFPSASVAFILGIICVVPLAISITNGASKLSDSDLLDEMDLDIKLDIESGFESNVDETARRSTLKLEMTFGNTGPGRLHNPMDIAVSSGGDIAVTDWNRNRVNIFDSSGSFKFKLNTRLDLDYRTTSNPVGVAIASSGHFFVTDFNPWVNVYNPQGDFVFQFQTDIPKKPNLCSKRDLRCLGITFDKNGRVLLGEYWNNRVSIHKPKGSVITSFNVSIEPRFLAVSQNKIAIGCLHCRKPIAIVDYEGNVLFTLKNPFQDKTWSTSGVCFTNQGDILVASNSTRGNAGIFRFSSSGEFIDRVTRDVVDPRAMVSYMDGKKVLVIDKAELKLFHWV